MDKGCYFMLMYIWKWKRRMNRNKYSHQLPLLPKTENNTWIDDTERWGVVYYLTIPKNACTQMCKMMLQWHFEFYLELLVNTMKLDTEFFFLHFSSFFCWVDFQWIPLLQWNVLSIVSDKTRRKQKFHKE